MMLRVCQYLSVILGYTLAGIGLLCGFYIFPKLIDYQIDDTVKLINGSDAYKRWETIPLPLHFKVYFFNVTNPDEVQLGAKPILNEIGPYIYNQFRHKRDIEQNDDKLSYYQDQEFIFNAEASKPNLENDIITVAHLPLMAIATVAEQLTSFVSQRLNTVIPELFYDPKNLFITTTPKDFLFDGIYIACDKKLSNTILFACSMIRENAPIHLEELEDKRFKFSLLSFKQNKSDGHYTVNSGVNYINLLGEILKWKNSSNLNNWQLNSSCNDLYGTDTTIFPPHQNKFSKIHIFQSDICRTVRLHYNKEIEYKSISGLRFTVASDMLGSGANYSFNQCYCLNKTKGIIGADGCLLDGAMELWSCQNVPIVLTLPHFLMAHELYKNSVDGLKSNLTLHETFVDIEPKSGTILRGSKRVQFNIFYRKIKNIDLTKNLSNSLMPVVWLEEGVNLNNENIQLLNDSLFYPMKILDGVYWTLISIGLAMGIIGMVWCILITNKTKDLF